MPPAPRCSELRLTTGPTPHHRQPSQGRGSGRASSPGFPAAAARSVGRGRGAPQGDWSPEEQQEPAGARRDPCTSPPRGGAARPFVGAPPAEPLGPGNSQVWTPRTPRAAGAPAQPRPRSPPRSPMWMMESARTDTHWHIQGRSHSVSASMSPGRAAHPPGPGARPRATRSGEAPVRVQSRAAPRESRARPCVFPRAPAPAPCARPSPTQPSPALSGSRSRSGGGCGGAGSPSPGRRGGGGPR